MLHALARWLFERDSVPAQASKGAIGAASYLASWIPEWVTQADQVIRLIGSAASAFCAVVMAAGIVIAWVKGRKRRSQ